MTSIPTNLPKAPEEEARVRLEIGDRVAFHFQETALELMEGKLMTSADIIIHVDRNPDITEVEIIDHVKANCDDPKKVRLFCIEGISRLAGNHQIRGNKAEWDRLIAFLNKEYFSK